MIEWMHEWRNEDSWHERMNVANKGKQNMLIDDKEDDDAYDEHRIILDLISQRFQVFNLMAA